MAEHKISGNDVLLFIDASGTPPYTNYNLVVCLTSQTLTRTTNEIDAKSKCGPDKQPGTQDNGITFDGQIIYDPAAGRISDDDLDDAWRNKTTIGFKMGKAVPAIGDVTYFGTGFISKLDNTYGEDAPSLFSGAIGPYGLINKTTATS